MEIYTPEEYAAKEVEKRSYITMDTYDKAMEDHLEQELIARGYTKRSPIEYKDSKNTRWAQDAKDWQSHLDDVMEYGLEIMNKYAAGESVPVLEDFIEALPKIQWTLQSIQ